MRFVNESARTVVECTYDYMGRRHTRKVSVNGAVSSYLRYMYRGYLQIAAIDAVSGVFRWFLFWDPTQPEAARPLAIRKDGTWYAYGLDLTGNVTEIFGKAGYLRTVYTYTPYGEVAAEGDVTQPIQWSSEYSDDELGLVYYNYRHLNPHDGRWISRDPIEEQGGWNLFAYVKNQPIFLKDYVGLISWGAKKIAPDPHPDLPKYKYSIDFWRIGNITLGYPEVYAALIGTRVDSSLAYEMFIKYLSKTGGEYKIDPQYIIDLESGESDGLQDNINLLARLAISYAIEHKCFEKKLYLDSWQLLQTRSSDGNYILGRYYMTMTATVNSDCSVDYTAYISDIYDFDHNSWLQTRFAALEKYGYAAPFNVRGNISGTYRKYKE